MTEETLKIIEELLFLTPAIRYTPISRIKNCRITQNSLLQKTQNGFWKGRSCISNILP